MKERRHDGMATVDGPLWAWGNNRWGQLGDGSTELRTTPVETDLPEDLVAIEAATNTVHAIRSDGTVLAWGHNPLGQLGDGTTTASAVPVTVKNLTGVSSIAAGDFVLAVKSDGTVWAWGRNDRYQLGNGTTMSTTTPVKVPGLSNVTAVAVGIATGYALQSDGSVWAWGDNSYGQCGGLARGDEYPEPVQVSSPRGQGQVVGRDGPVAHRSLGDTLAICAGAYAGYALNSDGTVWSWGANELGQLGNGERRTDLMGRLAQLTQHDEPGKVRNLDSVVSLASKGNSAYALKSDGTVWSWGDNRHGALGIQRTVLEWVGVGLSLAEAHHAAEATPAGAVAPLEVAGLSNVHAIAANGDSAYALKSDGTVWAWGENQFGELGDGSTQDRARPVQVVGLPRTTAIAAGITSAYAVALGTTGNAMQYCLTCGHSVIRTEAKFCDDCGAPLKAGKDRSESAQANWPN